MEWFKRHWHNVPQHLRRLLVFVAGWAVIIAGMAMLVLPGPGWGAIFLGFAILATEYTSAKQVQDWLVASLKKFVTWVKKLFGIKLR